MDRADERLSGAMFKIYYLFAATTGELLYIGRAQEPEKRKYSFERRTGLRTVFGGFQRFRSLEAACRAEREAIARHLPPFNKRISSTRGMTGKQHRQQAKQAIGAAHLGKILTEATREKLRQIAKERPPRRRGPMSEEQKQKIRETKRLIPFHWSAEQREQMSQKRKGKPSPIKGRTIGPHKNPRRKNGIE